MLTNVIPENKSDFETLFCRYSRSKHLLLLTKADVLFCSIDSYLQNCFSALLWFHIESAFKRKVFPLSLFVMELSAFWTHFSI